MATVCLPAAPSQQMQQRPSDRLGHCELARGRAIGSCPTSLSKACSPSGRGAGTKQPGFRRRATPREGLGCRSVCLLAVAARLVVGGAAICLWVAAGTLDGLRHGGARGRSLPAWALGWRSGGSDSTWPRSAPLRGRAVWPVMLVAGLQRLSGCGVAAALTWRLLESGSPGCGVCPSSKDVPRTSSRPQGLRSRSAALSSRQVDAPKPTATERVLEPVSTAAAPLPRVVPGRVARHRTPPPSALVGLPRRDALARACTPHGAG
jgi:hypothetical protein